MFCNYPVSIIFYLVALPLLVLAFFPRVVESVISKSAVYWAVAVGFVAGAVLWPSENHLMGDGLQRLSGVGNVFIFTEALDTLAHRLVYLIVGSPLWSYRIIAVIAGLFYLNGIRLLMRFSPEPLGKAIIALAFLCTASIQFYFGYVESYTLLNVFVLHYIYFSWSCIQEDRITFMPLVFFVLATLSHLTGIVLLPSLVFLYRARYRKLLDWAIPVIVVVIVAAFFLGRYWRTLVVLIPNEYSTYSLISFAHLKDLACELLLVSPAFLLASFSKRWDRTVKFTVIALASALLFTILFDPVLGSVRDWDILAIFALPLAGLIALRAPRHSLVVVALVVVLTVRVLPWIAFNSNLQLDFMKRTLAHDIHYSGDFGKGERLDSWGVLLHGIGDLHGAEEAWKGRLSYVPDRQSTLTMLAPLQYKMGKYSDSYQSYYRLLQSDPSNPKTLYHLVYVLFRLGELEKAEQAIMNSPSEFKDNPNTQLLLAGIIAAAGRDEEAITILGPLPRTFTEAYLPYKLAMSSRALGRLELARQLIAESIRLDSASVEYRQLADRLHQ